MRRCCRMAAHSKFSASCKNNINKLAWPVRRVKSVTVRMVPRSPSGGAKRRPRKDSQAQNFLRNSRTIVTTLSAVRWLKAAAGGEMSDIESKLFYNDNVCSLEI